MKATRPRANNLSTFPIESVELRSGSNLNERPGLCFLHCLSWYRPGYAERFFGYSFCTCRQRL